MTMDLKVTGCYNDMTEKELLHSIESCVKDVLTVVMSAPMVRMEKSIGTLWKKLVFRLKYFFSNILLFFLRDR